MISIATMITRLEGMLGTDDLTDWEQRFVRSVSERTAAQRRRGLPLELSDNQLEKLDELHRRHFAG